MPALLLVVLSLVMMAARVAAPFGQRIEGRELLVVRLSFVERVLFHRSGLYAFGVILLLVGVTGLLPVPFQVLAVLACYGVLTIPVRYRLTDAGIGLNNVVFRRWSEFNGVDVSSRAITLRGRPGNGRFTVRLLSAHKSEPLRAIRRHIRAETTNGAAVGKGGHRVKRAHV
jgi:hypothetical protein